VGFGWKVSTGKAFRKTLNPNSRFFAIYILKIRCCFGGFGGSVAPRFAPQNLCILKNAVHL
jgi:hypothetical protein